MCTLAAAHRLRDSREIGLAKALPADAQHAETIPVGSCLQRSTAIGGWRTGGRETLRSADQRLALGRGMTRVRLDRDHRAVCPISRRAYREWRRVSAETPEVLVAVACESPASTSRSNRVRKSALYCFTPEFHARTAQLHHPLMKRATRSMCGSVMMSLS